MNLHEYQGKEILESFAIKIPKSITIDNSKDGLLAAQKLAKETNTKCWVIKAQIHAGGRGKGGGVKLARTLDEVEKISSEIIGMQLITPQTSNLGKKVEKIMIAEDVYLPGELESKEYYISILSDRETAKNVIVYSPEGGMDIEKVAKHSAEKIFREFVDPLIGLQGFQARKIAFNLQLEGKSFKEFILFITNLYKAYESSDASLFEINPLLKNSNGEILAVDAKVVLDDNALFRHAHYALMRDKGQEDSIEVEAGEAGLNFIRLSGNVGCMVNGAGLAMATMDMIKLLGGEPANFLDVGGTADASRVKKAFEIILKEKTVKAILINIFGGIVRCDRVAEGIIEAYKSLGNKIDLPIVVRLQGTNAQLAKEMIDKSGLKVHSAITLEEASEKVKALLN